MADGLMRGNGDGHRPGWPGAPNGTMTNSAVGQTVSSVDGPVLTVKYQDGEKKIIVGPSVPVRLRSRSPECSRRSLLNDPVSRLWRARNRSLLRW